MLFFHLHATNSVTIYQMHISATMQEVDSCRRTTVLPCAKRTLKNMHAIPTTPINYQQTVLNIQTRQNDAQGGYRVCEKDNWASVCAKKRTVQSELNFCAQAKLTLQTFDTQKAPVVEVRKRQHLLSGPRVAGGRLRQKKGVGAS